MLGVLSEPLHGVTQQVDAVARGEVELQFVGVLQEVDGHRQHLRFGERQVVLQDRQFVVPVREAHIQRRLQAA